MNLIKKIEYMRKAGKLAAQCLRQLKSLAVPGTNLLELDQQCQVFLKRNSASGCLGIYNFPSHVSLSLNHEVCHGTARNIVLKDGDILTIDVVLKKDGYYADTAATVAVGKIPERLRQLIDHSKIATKIGIQSAQVGNKFLDIAEAVGSYVASKNLHVCDMFAGHGIGRKLHEEPMVLHSIPNEPEWQVNYPSTYKTFQIEFQPGMTFTIEPILMEFPDEITCSAHIFLAKNKGCYSSMFEHTILITEQGPEVLTC